MTARGKAMGGHHSAAAETTDWITPPAVLAALGAPEAFALDPCASVDQPWPCARTQYTIADDGLAKPWHGRVYLNPPYSTAELVRWLSRMAEHDCGTALIFARTETETFTRHVWQRASAILFIGGRLHFHVPRDTSFERKGKDPILVSAGAATPTNSGAPSVLIAYGMTDTDVLAAAATGVEYDSRGSVSWPDGRIPGQFIPLRIPRSVLGAIVAEQESAGTWRELVAAFLAERDGPISVADLYRAFADHPKAKANPHYREKLRQTLQRGEGEQFARVGPGLWERTSGTARPD